MTRIIIVDDQDRSRSCDVTSDLPIEDAIVKVGMAMNGVDHEFRWMPKVHALYECAACHNLIGRDRGIRDMGLMFCSEDCRCDFFTKEGAVK